MSHFAKVRDDVVVEVIVAEPEFFETFVDSSPGRWLQCSYNTRGGVHYDPNTGQPSADQSKALRKNFPGVGCKYDYLNDAFYAPQPYASWTLNKDTYLWEPPIPYPNNGKAHDWSEEVGNWVEVNITPNP